jgi:hypothetical protein
VVVEGSGAERERERESKDTCMYILSERRSTNRCKSDFPVHYAGLDHSGVQFATGKLMDLMTI